MGGSPKPPKQTDAQKAAERDSAALLKIQLKQAKQPVVLPNITPPKQLPGAPPVVLLGGESVNAAEEARRKAANRTNTARGTIFAGETGGYQKQKTTLLGGQ